MTQTTTTTPFPIGEDAPRWLREISGSLSVNAQFVISGNIHDIHLMAVGGRYTRVRTDEALWATLEASGYELLLRYDRVDQIRIHPHTDRTVAVAREVFGLQDDLPREVTLPRLARHMIQAATSRGRRVAMVLDYASRLTVDPQNLTEDEHGFLVSAEKLSHSAQPLLVQGVRGAPLYNAVFWLVNSERDLPAWLTADNDRIRSIPIPLPDLGDRVRLADLLLPSLPGAGDSPPADDEARTTFAEQTQGMTLRSMTEICRLAIDRGIPVTDIEDAVRCYRVGMLENPWKKVYLQDRIRTGVAYLGRRVRGQDRAIRKSLDILIRSTTGLTGAHASAHAARPRGILFFAGPTGVGKTELAKAITELVFGDETAYARFDMSEFSAEHSDARLIGAPPGYVGYDAGGELTNTVRRRPFSLVLFDEIEKANPKILDKFLQILEDGRLSDGSGNTVHFSETLIVFTSNIGVYVEAEDGKRVLNVDPGLPREELERRMRAAIVEHFTTKLNRPELLNRIGDNIVVFEFISKQVGHDLVDLFLANIVARVAKEMKVTLKLSDQVHTTLHELATADLSFGGRGIGSVLESAFVNPLARALFHVGVASGATTTATSLRETDLGWEVNIE